MKQKKTRRYQKQIDKMTAVGRIGSGIVVDGNKGNEMAKTYDDTQMTVEPGMTLWVDMPESYKKAWREYNKRKKQEAARRQEEAILKKLRGLELEERVREMEKRLFAKTESKTPCTAPDPNYPVTSKKKKRMLKSTMDHSVCNFIDARFFDIKRKEVDKTLIKKASRPSVLLIADVAGWAWWNKSKYLQMYLADEYVIDVICLLGPESRGINTRRYDLYVTYGYSYIRYLDLVPQPKRVTGMTAHRPLKMIKSYMKFADNLHANSIMLRNELQTVAEGKTVWYVPNGVDEEIFHPIKPIDPDGELVVGHVGKKCPQKGQMEIILPAMAKADVKSMTNLSDYTNKIPYSEMAQYYQNMDVFLVASVEDGTPNPALEAAACGRPIISNRIGNMPEFIIDGYNGFLVEREMGAYVEKLEYLKKNRDHLIEMGKNARKTVEEKWTWKIQAENYRRMFKGIIGR